MRALALVLAAACVTADCRRGPAAFTILHINDVYEIEPVAGGRAGGLARVATVRARLMKELGPVVTTLGGDYLSPSAIGTARVDGQPLAGRQMVAVLNALGLDWATFGNHEFDLPEAAFRQRMAEQKFKLVSSNVTNPTGLIFDGSVRSAVIPIRANGRELHIGLIGLTINSTNKPWVKYLPPIDAAKAEIARIRSSGPVDAVIALTHLTLAGDSALAEAVPDIDLILGGHEHENWAMRRGEGFTPIIKADANVRSVAVVRVVLGGGARPSISAWLEVIDDRVPADPAVAAIAAEWRAKAFDAFKRDGFTANATVASVPTALDGREAAVRNQPGLLTDIIAAGFLRDVGTADLALFNTGSVRIDDVLPPGPVSEYDVIRILPFGGRVLRATFDGALLAQVLDVGLKNRGTGGYLATANVSNTDGRWTIGDRPLNPSGRYTVALTDFLLTGGEANLGFLTRTNPHVRDIQEFHDVRQALIAELKTRYGGK